MYRSRIAAFRALDGFDPQNAADRDNAFKLLQSSLRRKRKVEGGRIEESLSTYDLQGTPERPVLKVHTISVWVKGSAVGDHSQTGKRSEYNEEIRFAFRDLLLGIQGNEDWIGFRCSKSARCVTSTGTGQDIPLRLSGCDDQSTADVRDAVNFLILYARNTPR
jgi:hypothetical protein